MSRKFTYFDINGLGESIRYILHYGGLEFEDHRLNFESFLSIKESLPYGQVPIYEENGRTINQSLAIARYVASQTDLLPSDPWEQAKLDAAVLNIQDLAKKLVAFYFTRENKDERRKALDEAIPFFLSRFEKELIAGGGHFGGKLSWADFVLLNVIETFNLYLDLTVHKDYPAITALMSEIHALPRIKEYTANRTKYVKPVLPPHVKLWG